MNFKSDWLCSILPLQPQVPSAASLPLAYSRWKALEDSPGGDGGYRHSSVQNLYLLVFRIFIIEGIATVIIGALLPWMLIDSPATQKFLSPEDTEFYIRRLRADYQTGGKDGETFKWKYVTAALTDWKIYLSTIIFWGNSIVVYG